MTLKLFKYIWLLPILVGSSVYAEKDPWLKISEGSSAVGYINSDEIKVENHSKKIFRAWHKLVLKEHAVKEFKNKNLSYSVTLKEHDCINQTSKTLFMGMYDAKGSLIDSMQFNDAKSTFIVPDTMDQQLHVVVCGLGILSKS